MVDVHEDGRMLNGVVMHSTRTTPFQLHGSAHLKARVHEKGEGRERGCQVCRQPVRANSDLLAHGKVGGTVLKSQAGANTYRVFKDTQRHAK